MPDLIETDEKFTPIALISPRPTNDGDMVITPTEKNEMNESKLARDRNLEAAAIEIFNAFVESLPSLSMSLEPWGIGVSIGTGPQNIAAHLAAHARNIRVLSDEHMFSASNSSRKSVYIR